MLSQCRLASETSTQIVWIPIRAGKIEGEVELLPEKTFWVLRDVFGTIGAEHLERRRAGGLSLESIAVPAKS